MACKPYHSNFSTHHITKTPSFPRPPAPPQPPLLPLPAQAPSPQYSSWPASRPSPRAKKPRCYDDAPGASAPISVAAPSRKRVAPATVREEVGEWTGTDSLYSVSPPPSSVPMPTSLLVTVTAARKAPTACAEEVTGAGGGVDVGATDELRRLLRL
ncbi:predicted GPI-anchored protein 58 [Phragmites australis]|uniref:predicted GPI-anchored protein 58 n=1 Tax=Phragmites australis TaxID=29695 RepID=UPI002D767767|nr:predicted GPI-anchored protein 58 [Phragmites australis]